MKMTKQLCTLLLALLMFVAMPLTLHAQESTVTATVIATNEPTYQITIPNIVEANDLHRTAGTSYYQKEFSISVSEIDFLNGKEICVRVYGDDGEFALYNADRSDKLAYEVYSTADTENALNSGDVFASFTEPSTQNGYIQIDQKDITREDTYTGNLSFAFFIVDSASN